MNNNNGWIYLLTNPSMDGMIKIGKTNRDPSDRVKELSSATGVPTPFILIYKEHFADCDVAEKHVHTLLEINNFRLSSNREFFVAPIDIGISAIIDAKHSLGEGDLVAVQPEYGGFLDFEAPSYSIAKELFTVAEKHFYGLENYVQDKEEGLRLFQKAYKLRYEPTYLLLGQIYATDADFQDKKRARSLFKEGAKGTPECFAELAILSAEELHRENASKYWTQYYCSGYDRDPTKLGRYGAIYIYLLKEDKVSLVDLDLIKDDLPHVYEYYAQQLRDIVEYKNRVGATEALDNMFNKELAKIDFLNYLYNGHFKDQRVEGTVATFSTQSLDCTILNHNVRYFFDLCEVLCFPKILNKNQRVEFTSYETPHDIKLAYNIKLL
ncbi:MAG: hypothetical protein A2X82_03585 [Geobacteraceae bacterium GWC2_55_20]|nr:MAG: hypothetical protein A2X82_03585 [Geobacteraceae bacterium GWC2_55_20]HCE68279.1 hypothetical protein [Geobacter sp.]